MEVNFTFDSSIEERKEITLSFERGVITEVFFKEEQLLAKIDGNGETQLCAPDGSVLDTQKPVGPDGEGRLLEKAFCQVKGNEIILEFPVYKYIDHYPHCDGEHDRWSQIQVDTWTLHFAIKPKEGIVKKICCVNDMPGVGKIALSAMIPILSAKGVDVTCLPTALVSNTLDFGKFDILDTTDYMERAIGIWDELGFSFDCISTGFMVNPKQVDVVEKLISQQGENTLVVVDPIMGDEGKLYNGMSDLNISIMRKLSARADILIPNLTEACFLTDLFVGEKCITNDQALDLLNACRALGAKSVIITSVTTREGNYVIGYDHLTDEVFRIKFDMIDARFPGTGDVFSASLVGDVLDGACLRSATENAMKTVSAIIQDNLSKEEKFFGVDIERFIGEGKL